MDDDGGTKADAWGSSVGAVIGRHCCCCCCELPEGGAVRVVETTPRTRARRPARWRDRRRLKRASIGEDMAMVVLVVGGVWYV